MCVTAFHIFKSLRNKTTKSIQSNKIIFVPQKGVEPSRALLLYQKDSNLQTVIQKVAHCLQAVGQPHTTFLFHDLRPRDEWVCLPR